MIRGFDNRVVKFLRFAALLPPTKACTLGMPLEHQVDLRPYPAHTKACAPASHVGGSS